MSVCVTITRGSDATFTAQFLDANDNPVTPASASVYILYRTATGRAETTVAMTNNAGTWTAVWPTAGAAAGIVYYTVLSVGPASACDGTFPLTANLANPGP